MPVDWINTQIISFNAMLLLERVQLSWFPGWLPEPELAIALQANPVVTWFMRHKCPEIDDWLDQVMAQAQVETTPEQVRQAETAVLQSINDLLTYALDPAVYDAQPFLRWDSDELTAITDFTGKTVLDIGSGTGRLAFTVIGQAKTVYAVEPVANLRRYLKEKARHLHAHNFYAVDGIITDIPFPADFADIVMGGHVFGDEPEAEWAELARVTRPGGMVILCPGNNVHDKGHHAFLKAQGCQWARFEEPDDGIKRKYWWQK